MAPLEEDNLFQPTRDKPTKLDKGERIPYHKMTEEQRREAWAAVRKRQQRRARGHRRTPMLFGGASLSAFVTAGILLHYHNPLGSLFLWIGVVLLGFGVIAVGANALGRLSGNKDDSAPPGF